MSSFEAYEESLSIPREPFVPPLGPNDVVNIGGIVFMKHNPQPADVLFIFGTVQADWEGLAEAILRNDYQKIIVAGKTGPTWFDRGEPIAHSMRAKLVARGVPEDQILVQPESQNTLEDVTLSLPFLNRANAITYAAKSHHSGRCQRTLRKFFPEAILTGHLQDAYYGDFAVTSTNWSLTDIGRARVYGEYRRIVKYVERGDIASAP